MYENHSGKAERGGPAGQAGEEKEGAKVIRYRDLTEEQKAVICNGCGPKGGWLPVPDFFCHASCDHHDFNYWLGHTEADREKADHEFLEAMLADAGDDPAKQTIAITYWLAVRVFGAVCFHYADRERDEEDLRLAMEAAA